LGTALADAAAPVSPAAVAEPAPPDADLTVIAEPDVRPSRRWGRRRFEKSARSSAKPTPPAGEPRVYDFMAEDDPDFVDDTTGVARTRDRERNRDRKSERQRDRHVADPTIDGTTGRRRRPIFLGALGVVVLVIVVMGFGVFGWQAHPVSSATVPDVGG